MRKNRCPFPRRTPAFFGNFSTHDDLVLHEAWAVLRGKLPIPKGDRDDFKAVRCCVDFLFEDHILGEKH